MKLWTITSDRTKWSNQFTLRRSDSMGNVLDRLEESKDGIIALVEYEDGFLDQFRDVYEKYALQVKEHEEYDNDDYDIYESSDSEYKSKITLDHLTVISDGRPVGQMIESKEYGGGMDNRTWSYGTILFFDKPNAEAGETYSESYTVYDKNGRYSTRSVYTMVKYED